MKINEIVLLESWVYEGLFDTLKKGIDGATAGFAAGGQQRAGAARQQEVAKVFIDRWNSAVAQNPAVNTPKMLQQFMTNSTRVSGITVPDAPAQLNAAVTAKYITDVIGQSMAARAIGPAAQTDTAATADSTELAPAKKTLAPGVKVTDDDPLILNYRNVDYARNDKGQWAALTQPNKPLSTAMGAFFDKQSDVVDAAKAPSTPTADAPASTTTTPAAATAPRVPRNVRSPKGIQDTSTEVFVRGHGVVQKQNDGSWKSLVNNGQIRNQDVPKLEQMLSQQLAGASTAEPTATPAADPTTSTVTTGAPIDSAVEVGNNTVKVTFTKTDAGWKSSSPKGTVHQPGTKNYDALETKWAQDNDQPAPARTVLPATSVTPAAPATVAEPVMTEMQKTFRRLDRIVKG